MIDGVVLTELLRLPDERGTVMRMMRSSDPHFSRFGEVYFSSIHPGAIKAWHHHRHMTLNYAVPVGTIKLVLFDDRNNSPTKGVLQEIFIGESNYQLVTIPSLIWNGFKCVGTKSALVANLTDVEHHNSGMTRKSPDDPYFGYDWAIRNR